MADVKLGSQGNMVTLPPPIAREGCVLTYLRVESRERNLDAGLGVDTLGIKRVWRLSWTGLTASQVNLIRTQHDKVGEVLDFQPVDGSGPYDVVVYDLRVMDVWVADGLRYNVTLTVEEV